MGSLLDATVLPGSMLLVHGMFVDEVAFVGAPMVLDERKRLSHMKFEELLRLSGIENGTEKWYVWGGNLEDAYCRTLCGDVLLPISPGSRENIRRVCAEDKNRYEKYRAAIKMRLRYGPGHWRTSRLLSPTGCPSVL
jgi:hypothetical protein